MIITIGGTKGGSGKSTLATNLAVIYSARGHKVLLVDTDEQATSYDFTQLRIARLGDAGYTCTKQHGGQVHHALLGFQPAFDCILVDTGGRDSKEQRAAMLASDLVVLPVVPRVFDTWAMSTFVDTLDLVRQVNPRLRALSYINRGDRSGALLRGAEDLLNTAAFHHGIIYGGQIRLHTRVAFGLAAASGLAVTESQPRDKKAAEEMLALAEHIEQVTLAPSPFGENDAAAS